MLNFKVLYVQLELLVGEGSQEDKERLLDLDHRVKVHIVDVGAQLFNDLDAVLSWHLEVKYHQTHWHNG